MVRLTGVLLAGGILLGAAASAAALYGRYRVLPAALTGPAICKLEAGGCQVLFRTPSAALLGVPNAALGLLFYGTTVAGLALGWPRGWLFPGASAALAMSGFLARTLVVQNLECRVCWAGHAANLAVWLALLASLKRSNR
jgi:uncharacterized membrane protein